MHVGNVVPFEIVVDVHLPVSVHVVIDAPHERQLVDAGGRDPLADPREIRLERLGPPGQRHEYQPPPLRERYRGEAVVTLVEQLHLVEVRHAAQHPVESVGPAVILADQHVGVAVLHGERSAAVAAHVVKRPQLAVLPAHDDDRLAGDVRHDMVSRLSQLVDVGDVLPRGGEYRVAIELVKLRVSVPGRRDRFGARQRTDAQVGRAQTRAGADLRPRHYGLNRLYLRSTLFSRSCGSAYTVRSSAPVMVWAASMALTMASSVA